MQSTGCADFTSAMKGFIQETDNLPTKYLTMDYDFLAQILKDTPIECHQTVMFV